MLTPTEKIGCREILEKLTDPELLSLKDTITKRQINVETRADQFPSILSTASVIQDQFLSILIASGFIINYRASWTLHGIFYIKFLAFSELCGRFLDQLLMFMRIATGKEAMKAILSYSACAAELLRRKKLRRDFIFQYLADNDVVVPATMEKHDLIQRTLNFWGSDDVPDNDPREIESGTSSTQTELGSRTVGTTTAGGSQQVVAPATAVTPNPAADTSIHPSPHKHQVLGETFVRWFYELLNSQNPTHRGGGDGEFGPHHFWENCSLKLVCQTPDMSEEVFDGCILVAQRLKALAREELLIFNPNVSSDGIRVRSDPHGLLIVMVCGTIHQHNSCLGTFQQMFGLISTPTAENTWKIKTSHLRIQSREVTTIPKLTDSSSRELLPVT